MDSSDNMPKGNAADVAKVMGISFTKLVEVAKTIGVDIKTPDQVIDGKTALNIAINAASQNVVSKNKNEIMPASLNNKLTNQKKLKAKGKPRINNFDKAVFHGTNVLIGALSLAVLFIGGAAGVRICKSESGDIAVNKSGLKAKWKG